MKQRMRRLALIWAALVATGLATAAAVLLPASSAAAVPSGAGWSASWDYYTPDAFQVHLTIPGGQVDGYGTDHNGTRQFFASVHDADGRDRACVRVRLLATGVGRLGSATACNGATEILYTEKFSQELFVHIDLIVDGAITKSFFTFVPSSTNDPGLRTPGTGTEWRYTTAAAFHVEVHRPGVQVIGDGSNQLGATRLLGAAVAHENVANGCVLGSLADAATTVGDGTCEPGKVPSFVGLFTGYVKVVGCYTPPASPIRCLTMHVPEPH